MNETSLSLLERLRDPDQSDSWDRLVSLYTPLIARWLRNYEVQKSDADDLLQEVLLAVSKDIKAFEHRGRVGAFRSWLKKILMNRLRKHWRTRDRNPKPKGDSDMDARIAELSDPNSELSQRWNREHDQYVLRQLLELTEPNFAPTTWRAFLRVTFDRAKPQDVAEELGITLNSVCLAKSRVLRRLRQEADGLVDDSTIFSPSS